MPFSYPEQLNRKIFRKTYFWSINVLCRAKRLALYAYEYAVHCFSVTNFRMISNCLLCFSVLFLLICGWQKMAEGRFFNLLMAKAVEGSALPKSATANH